MKRPKFKFGFYLLFFGAAIACFFCAGLETVSIFETNYVKDILAVGFTLLAACIFVTFGFEIKDMEEKIFSKKN